MLPALSALMGSFATACYFQQSSIRCSEEPTRPPTVRRVKVARAADFQEGELRQVRIPPTSDGAGEGAILLTLVDGEFYATGASCSHYSAPLAEGVAARDKMHVVCPWHNAAFDIRTGQPVRGQDCKRFLRTKWRWSRRM